MFVHCLNNISKFGLARFDEHYSLTKNIDEAELIMVRSANMHELTVPNSLFAVARAGAGVNNIPLDNYAKKGIVVFNTPGANANGVKELVIAGMLLSARDIYGGLSWVKSNQNDPEIAKTVEKAKAQFAGTEISGKNIGIIGMGAIGILVAGTCHALGMNVYGYDVFFNEERRSMLPPGFVFCDTVDELYGLSDYITLHVPLTPETKGMIDEEVIKKMRDHVVILNYSRDSLVNDDAMEDALQSHKVHKYVTDFPNARTSKMEGVLCIPHLGASTEESEDNCAVMAANQLIQYAEHGSIVNSVNAPNCVVNPKQTEYRLCVLHQNTDQLLPLLTETINQKMPILNLANCVRGNLGYSVFDVDHAEIKQVAELIQSWNDIYRVRLI